MAQPLRSVPEQQLGLDETIVTDTRLEEALEARQRDREAVSAARAKYKLSDEEAQAALAGQELPTGKVLRVGRFRIERKATTARHVAFDTAAGTRLSIRTVDEE